MKRVSRSEKGLNGVAGSALVAWAMVAAPGPLRAQSGPPSVPALPSPDVYTILARNPGLAAALPVYSEPQVTGRYSSLTVIGDSYGDWGNALQFNPVSTQVGANGRYGNALGIVDALQYHYALPTAAVANYAFGGASTGSANNNPPELQLPGFAQQVQALVDSGRRFGAGDLITLTTAGVGGGNDAPLGISVAQGTANIVGYMNTLVDLGGSEFLLNVPSASVEASLQTALAQFVSRGIGIRYFNFGDLVDNILAAPTAYGFAPDATTGDYCGRLGGSHECNEGGINKVRTQTTAEIFDQNRHLYFYAHPTTSLAAWIAQGDVRLLDAPARAVPEPSPVGILGLGLVGIAATAAGRRRWPRSTEIAPIVSRRGDSGLASEPISGSRSARDGAGRRGSGERLSASPSPAPGRNRAGRRTPPRRWARVEREGGAPGHRFRAPAAAVAGRDRDRLRWRGMGHGRRPSTTYRPPGGSLMSRQSRDRRDRAGHDRGACASRPSGTVLEQAPRCRLLEGGAVPDRC